MPSMNSRTTEARDALATFGCGAIESSAAMTSRYVTALTMNDAPAPNLLSTRPASAGPNARDNVNCIEFRRTAFIRSSRGTSDGTNACHEAMLMPPAHDDSTTSVRMDATLAFPVTHTPHSANAASICTVWVMISTWRRW